MNLTARRKAATELDIARIAARMFSERGLAATTAEAIAQEAGLSLRTFYRYFRTKEDAVAPLMSAGARRWQDVLQATPVDVPILQALENAAQATLALCGDDPDDLYWTRDLLRTALQDTAMLGVWAKVNHASEQRLRDLLANRLGKDQADIEVRLLSAAAIAAIRIAVEDWAESGGNERSMLEKALYCMRHLAGDVLT